NRRYSQCIFYLKIIYKGLNQMTDGLIWMKRMIFILSCCILAILMLIWVLTPAKSLAAGFILGELIGLFNVLYLAHRIRIVGKRVISGLPRIGGSGLFVRLLTVILGIGFTYRFPEWFDGR